MCPSTTRTIDVDAGRRRRPRGRSSRVPSSVRGLWNPGVSVNTTWASSVVQIARMSRRVVWGLSETIATFCPDQPRSPGWTCRRWAGRPPRPPRTGSRSRSEGRPGRTRGAAVRRATGQARCEPSRRLGDHRDPVPELAQDLPASAARRCGLVGVRTTATARMSCWPRGDRLGRSRSARRRRDAGSSRSRR